VTTAGCGGAGAGIDRGGQQQPTGGHRGQREDDRDGEEVRRAAHAPPGDERADPGADQAAQRVHGVEAGQDRPAVALLDRHAVGVHGHVDDAVHRSPDEHRGRQDDQVTGQGGTGERDDVGGQRHYQGGPTADAGHQHATHLQADQRARLQPGERHRELPAGQAQVDFDRRDPRRPGGADGTDQQERHRDADAGAAQP
jgi:hypothetical protein